MTPWACGMDGAGNPWGPRLRSAEHVVLLPAFPDLGAPGQGVGCCQSLGLLTPGPTAPCQQSRAACLGREGSALGAARHAAELAQPQGMSPFHPTASRKGDATKGQQDGSGGGSAGPGGHTGGANCLCDQPSLPSEPGVSPELKTVRPKFES